MILGDSELAGDANRWAMTKVEDFGNIRPSAGRVRFTSIILAVAMFGFLSGSPVDVDDPDAGG